MTEQEVAWVTDLKVKVEKLEAENKKLVDTIMQLNAPRIAAAGEQRRRVEFIEEVVRNVEYPTRRFVVTDRTYDCTVHVEYMEKDVDADEFTAPTLQQSRRWVINAYDSESEIVATCFACIMRSYDHVVGEHFTYKGRRVYSPHFSIGSRLMLADHRETYGKDLEKKP